MGAGFPKLEVDPDDVEAVGATTSMGEFFGVGSFSSLTEKIKKNIKLNIFFVPTQ
jgi:hypothetical protein